MADWSGKNGEARRVAGPRAAAEERMPYRAMPLPRSPPRSWRPVVERALALFNAAALVALAVWWVNHEGELHDYQVDQARVLAGVALGGMIGFLGWFSYGLRLKVIFVSGLVWAFSGAVTLFYGLSGYPYMLRLLGRNYPATAGGVVFVAVGIASVVTFWTRDRTRRVRDAQALGRGLEA